MLKFNVSDTLSHRTNGKQLKKAEWWSRDKERQRPRKEGCTDQRPVPPVTCQDAHLLSLLPQCYSDPHCPSLFSLHPLILKTHLYIFLPRPDSSFLVAFPYILLSSTPIS